MSVSRTSIRTTVQGEEIKHLLLKQSPPTGKLMIILPGRGYTSDHPILHYARQMAADNGYDVLSIVYSFQLQRGDFGTMNIFQEIEDAISTTLARGKYDEIVFCGKSMGTPLALAQAQSILEAKTRLILLTPISDVVASVGDIPTLAVIGTADQYYNTSDIEETKRNPRVQWKVYEKLNHGLEDPDDWKRSIEALSSITADCEAFLKA